MTGNSALTTDALEDFDRTTEKTGAGRPNVALAIAGIGIAALLTWLWVTEAEANDWTE